MSCLRSILRSISFWPGASFWRSIPAALLALHLADAAPATAQSVRVFGDWQAACDNLRRCHALGLPREDGETAAFLQLSRDSEATAQPEAALILAFGSEDPEIKVRIEFYPAVGDPGLPREAATALGPEGRPRVTAATDKVPLLINALRRAETLRVRRLDKVAAEEIMATVSLRGAAAALRWIDEQQGRTGNVSALIARGDRPAGSTPPPPLPLVVTASAFAPLNAPGRAPVSVQKLWRQDCAEWTDLVEGEEIGFRISEEFVLWQMPCMRAAYNMSNRFYLVSGGGAPIAVRFQRPENGALVADIEEIVNGEFSEDDRSIAFFNKARGPGDCGTRGAYVWDGNAFRLTHWQEMIPCRGATLDLWPIVWRVERRGRR